MSDLHSELLELAGDLRAALEDAMLRGAWAEVIEPPVAASVETLVAPPPIAAPSPRPSSASAWAALADRSRKASENAVREGAEGLRRIREDLGDCRRCSLCTGRKNIVYGVGDPEADLVVVGEGPGHDEDLQGEPFVGAAGQMLDKMLENVLGLPRGKVYIANVVKCRPPGNRNPAPEEIAACRPFLERQLLAIRPKVVLVLGSVALKALLDSDQGIMKRRGIWTEWQGMPVLPTFHPAYLLRNPADKRLTFDDLKQLRTRYDELGGKR